jgi:hypothetical protein
MAISGLFTFAWTTGELFSIVESQRQLVEDLALQRKKKKTAMEGVFTRVTGQAHPLETHEEQAEASLTRDQRRALREEIETKLNQLHEAERAEVEALRRHES